MKKNFLKIFFIAITGIAATSCLPEDELTYEGPTVVEFKNHTLGKVNAFLDAQGIVRTPSTQVQNDSSRTILMNVRTTDTVYVQLVGPQLSTATEVDFTLRSSGTNMAVEGTHFNFVPANNRKVTIPANSSVGYLLIRPVANSLPTVGDLRAIRLDLKGNAAIKANPNYDSFIVTLRR
jgi:hypothetical protein